MGLWDNLKANAAAPNGFAGNPLFMAGMRGLGATAAGSDWGAAMAEGMQGANRLNMQTAEQAQRQQQWQAQQQMQAQQLAQGRQQMDLQRAQGTRAALEFKKTQELETLWNTPEMRAEATKLGIPEGTPASVGWQLFSARGNAKFAQGLKSPWKLENGLLVNRITGETKLPGGRQFADRRVYWSAADIRKEYDLSKYDPAAVRKALETGDPVTHLTPDKLNKGTASVADWSKVVSRYDSIMKPLDDVFRSGATVLSLLDKLDTDPTGVRDLGGLVAFTKLLDPGSVAREGEVALTRSAQSLIDQLKVMGNKIEKGYILSAAQRVQMSNAARDIMQIYANEYISRRKSYVDTAEYLGVREKDLGPAKDWSALGVSGDITGLAGKYSPDTPAFTEDPTSPPGSEVPVSQYFPPRPAHPTRR